MRREYERREGTIEVRKKVEYSKQLNASRLKILQAREDAVQGILTDAQARLVALSSDATTYGRLLQGLLVQAAGKLGEPKVVVWCRTVDIPAVRAVLPQAAAACAQLRGGAGVEFELDEAHPLPPAPKGAAAEGLDTW